MRKTEVRPRPGPRCPGRRPDPATRSSRFGPSPWPARAQNWSFRFRERRKGEHWRRRRQEQAASARAPRDGRRAGRRRTRAAAFRNPCGKTGSRGAPCPFRRRTRGDPVRNRGLRPPPRNGRAARLRPVPHAPRARCGRRTSPAPLRAPHGWSGCSSGCRAIPAGPSR